MDTSLRLSEGEKRIEIILRGKKVIFKYSQGEITTELIPLIKFLNMHMRRMDKTQKEELDSILKENIK